MAGVELVMERTFTIGNVLAERYASVEMRRIWSREEKVLLERRFWIAVMKAQKKLGLSLDDLVIKRYEEAKEVVDLESIDRREKVTRHDVKARIDEFNALAGEQSIHLGMTSRDLTENIELFQIKKSLELISMETIGLLVLLNSRMKEHANLVMVGRSHNMPAQLTTLGKRFANTAEELLFAYERLVSLKERLPIRGLRGPVGTGQDLADLTSPEAAMIIESEVASDLGFMRILDATGQIYPRSIDFEVVSTLVQLSAAASSLATTIRLMSGAGLVSEGHKDGQVGSSAMPHKVNARSSERINGLSVILKGYLSMVSEISGDQWNEGDVSCSVVRRVALPDAFFSLDGIFQTLATILREMNVFEDVVRREVEQELPFVSTTRLLSEAIKQGMGREDAHRLIQGHALAAKDKVQHGERVMFVDDLASDGAFPLNRDRIQAIMDEIVTVNPVIEHQISRVMKRIDEVHSSQNYPSFIWHEIR